MLVWLCGVAAGLAPCECRFCHTTFPSRNALFRHVRAECPSLPRVELPLEKRWLVVGVAYDGVSDGAAAEATVAAFLQGATVTRATAAKHRSTTYECESAARGDVLAMPWPRGASVDELEAALLEVGVRLLWTGTTTKAFHAERTAERAYHYVLPLEWLDGWRDDEPELFDDDHRMSSGGRYGVDLRRHAPRGDHVSAARDALRRLKAVLRAAEDAFAGNHSWHNLATATAVSAHARPLVAPLGRFRVADLVRDADGRPHAVVEVRAQHFVQSQVRRMMAVAVAMHRGLLPADFWTTIARRDVVARLGDLVAPEERLYFAGARYAVRQPRRRNRALRDARTLFDDVAVATGTDDIITNLLRRADDATFLTIDLPRAAAGAMASLSSLSDDRITELRTPTKPVPDDYREVLQLLREAWADVDRVPRTSMKRSAVMASGGSFTLANPRSRARKLPLANARFPALAAAVFNLERGLRGGTVSQSCAVNRCAQFLPHVDSGEGSGQSMSYIVGLGDYNGGALVVEGDEVDIHYRPREFDGWKRRHWTQPFQGERFSLVWFTANDHSGDKVRRSEASDAAQRLGLKYRPNSTDVDAIHEVIVRDCYALNDASWSPAGHVVLDGGGHIGCFSRLALDRGALAVRAYEPEPSNAALLRHNAPGATIIEAALDRDGRKNSTLVLGPPRARDDAQNTWRHALRDVTHYKNVDRLESTMVRCASFFEEALDDDVTFVKLDIEGAELGILDEFPRGAWRNVRRLVFEYSFTKRPSLATFHAIVANLQSEGFDVSYDFQGSLIDDASRDWPGHADAVIFCERDP